MYFLHYHPFNIYLLLLFLLPSGPSKQYEWGVVEEAKIPVHELVGQRGKGAYYWDNKINYMCSCSTSPL